MTERDIFLAVLDLPDPAARAAYLDSACGGDAQRRARVETLLQAHENAGSFLAEPVMDGHEPGHVTSAFTSTADGSANSDDEALSFLAPAQRPDSLGRIGHYEVLEVLGRGGFGIVFRAHDEVLQRVVAVKVLAPAMATTSPARKRFLREARSSAQVRHENVVQVYAVEEQPLPFLVMEFIPGETLQQRLDRTGPLDVPEVLRIGRQVAEGLTAAHAQGLIHRDIKPANVMIGGGAGHRVKLTDFGLARAADDASISQSGVVAGTPLYMAPEQAKGETLDHRADLFSLGSVLYTMLTGHPPFRAATTLAVLKRVTEDTPRPIREVIPEVPAWLCRIVAKLHAKGPAERFQSAREVADLLADCETQWKSDGGLKDFSRIPGGKLIHRRGAARGGFRVARSCMFVAIAGMVLVPLTVCSCGYLYFRARQDTILLPAKESTTSGPGWVELFNGKNLDGWHEVGSKGTWVADNGVLRAVGRAGYLVSDRSYTDFHLKAEVRISPGTDFGILFHTDRVRANAAVPPASGHGVEFTYAGPTNDVAGQIGMNMQFIGETPGALLGHNLKPYEWLPFEILVQGDSMRADISGGMIGANFPKPHKASPVILRLAKNDSVIELRNIRIQDLSAAVTSEPSTADEVGWVKLFNGKDLTGWKTLPGQPADWKVEKGELVGRSLPGSWLFSETEYVDFHLRAEVKLNTTGNSGVFFRTQFVAFRPDEAPGYEADLSFVEGDPSSPIGTLWKDAERIREAAKSPTAPDQWFTLEVVANGPWLQVLVNGKQVADHTDTRAPYVKGHIALQATEKDTEVRFRTIEIKVLRSEAGPGAAKSDQELIQGTWNGVSANVPAIPEPLITAAIQAVGPTVTFAGDKLTWKANPAPEAKDVLGSMLAKFPEGVFHLDPTKSPKTIDVAILGQNAKTPLGTPAPRVLLGIYKLDGDALEICIAIDPDRAEERPMKLESMPGKSVVHVKLRRQPAPAAVQPLRDLAAAKRRALKSAQARVDAGQGSAYDLVLAKVELTEAELHLAEAVKNRGALLMLLQQLVQQREEERQFVRILVDVGRAAATELDSADARVAEAKARLAKARSTKPESPATVSAVVQPGLIKKFGPTDRPLTQNGVGAAENGWFIKADSARTVFLYDVPNPGRLRGGVAVRAQVKTGDLEGLVYLELAFRYPEMRRGDERPTAKKLIAAGPGRPEWQSVEVVFAPRDLQENNPAAFEINLEFAGAGTLWIKDVELVAVEPNAAHP